MAVRTFTLGVSEIKIGAVDPATLMVARTNLASIGYTNEGSASLTFNEPDKTEFYAEEVDDPVLTFSKQGKIEFAFDVMNPDIDTMAALMGGQTVISDPQATAQSPTDTWNAPGAHVRVEKAIIIVPRQGYTIMIPRADIVARMGDNLTKTELLVLHITGTVLTPLDATGAPSTLNPKIALYLDPHNPGNN